MSIDLDYVRDQFPALAGEWTFMDNAGGSQTLEPVVRRIQEYLRTSDVQLGASYDVSRLAGERVAAATAAMADWVGARESCEVVLGPSTSMLIRILSLCLAELFEPGDEVIVTNCDHEANIGAWMDLAGRGITVKTWKLNTDTWTLELEDLERLMTDRTKLVALTHTSNILGGINPIREVSRFVHDRGAMVCVDGVAYAPHRPIDVRTLDVDFYAFSFYKVYGPHYALLYGKREHLLRMPGINHFFIGDDQIPYKFQPGSVNYELCYGMLGLWDYVEGFVRAHDGPETAGGRRANVGFFFDVVSRHEQTMTARMLDFLGTKKDVRLIGRNDTDRTRRVPTLSFVVGNRKSDSITREVDKHRIGIRYGDFYARRLIDDLGLGPQNGVVRVSLVHYNTMDEVDRLIGVLDRLF